MIAVVQTFLQLHLQEEIDFCFRETVRIFSFADQRIWLMKSDGSGAQLQDSVTLLSLE